MNVNKINLCLLAVAMSAAIGVQTLTASVLTVKSATQTESKSESKTGDQVLVDCKHATETLRAGDFDAAKEALDRALLTMNASLSGTKDAKKARSVFHKESVKTFIGEPYERVMANYYRGILYWKAGEIDNARACFRTAQLHDTSKEEANRSDFVILDYLDGLANAMTGADSEGPLKLARQNSSCELPGYSPKANVLIFLEAGNGPIKFADGKNNEHLAYHGGASSVESITVALGDQTVSTPVWDNLTHQAETRGGREMDQILTNKAAIKTTTDTVGTVALVAGAATAVAGGDGRVAAGLAAFGVVSKLVSSAAKPEADTRCWDTLPQNLAFATFEAPPGEHRVSIKFLDKSQAVVSEKQLTARVESDGTATVLFIKD